MLRNGRKWDQAHRRKYYRRIEAEKKRLIDSGVDPELVRLLCRYLANPRNQKSDELILNNFYVAKIYSIHMVTFKTKTNSHFNC